MLREQNLCDMLLLVVSPNRHKRQFGMFRSKASHEIVMQVFFNADRVVYAVTTYSVIKIFTQRM